MATRQLDSSPSMLAMFLRAGTAMIPGVSKLPVVGRGGSAKEVPDLELLLDAIEVDRERLAAYDRVCGFSVSDVLPPSFPHMLAFPLHLALMTDSSFPFPAIGLVHIENRITQQRPLRADERLTLRVHATPLEPHPRGTQFSLVTEVTADGEPVWEEVSTNLRRGSGLQGQARQGSERKSEDQERELPATATWKLPADLGRRYGAVSGDLNPIHVHSLTARLFGFSSAIAHGMWTKARCLAALEPELPHAFTVQAAFKRPILLPATVNFAEASRNGAIDFSVRDERKGTPHLDGSLNPL